MPLGTGKQSFGYSHTSVCVGQLTAWHGWGGGFALGWRFKVLVEVGKVCQVSQLYASIDDLATGKLESMLPSLFTLQASVVFLMNMCYSPFFSLHYLGGEISCNLILKDRWRQISTLTVFI